MCAQTYSGGSAHQESSQREHEGGALLTTVLKHLVLTFAGGITVLCTDNTCLLAVPRPNHRPRSGPLHVGGMRDQTHSLRLARQALLVPESL